VTTGGGWRSNNFIIGLTNVSPEDIAPVIGNYEECGRYPGAVGDGETVTMRCTNTDLPPARYVIVQFPSTDGMNFCELDVCAEGTQIGRGCFYAIHSSEKKYVWKKH